MTEKTLTTENIKPALDALRGELAPWPVVAMKQDKLNNTQKSAVNSGITSSLVAQIIANTAAIRALESAITGTGLRALVVSSLPAVGTTGILYIVPVTTYDPDTDADVVNYSNEYIWIPVEGGTASEGHYEQVGQTGIVINNGQLTITVNGTSVGTFTANQSGNTTAAVTVPTNADYVDRTTDQTVAGVKTFSSTINGTASKAIADEDGTSIKTGYVNVAGNQTVTGQKTWTGENLYTSNLNVSGFRIRLYDSTDDWTVTPTNTVIKEIDFTDKNNSVISYFAFQHRSNTTEPFRTCWRQNKKDGTTDYYSVNFNNLGEFYPEISNTKLGTSSNQWSSVYAQSYYYNGTEFSNKFVTTDTNQEIGGTKAFTGSIRPYGLITHLNQSLEKGTIPSSSKYGGIIYNDKTFANNVTHRFAEQLAVVTPNGTSGISLAAYKWETNSQLKTKIVLNYPLQGNTFLSIDTDEVIPETTAVTDLGTSTNKWKTLNGINPGALSLPNVNAVAGSGNTQLQDISGDLVQDQYFNCYFTPRMDGWAYIALNCSSATIRSGNSSFSVMAKTAGVFANALYTQSFTKTESAWSNLVILFPVTANKEITLECTFTGFSVTKGYVIPCLGNV